jgi:ubiquinone/menaquinone biosynthesis C-methylase UbiE
MSSPIAAIDAYNAAADRYDDPVNSHWARFSERTLARLPLRPGDRVLDAGCGTGAFSIPAAERVGPGGRVLGVDLADGLLDLARAKARARGLANVAFALGDLAAIDDDGPFDAVVSVFSVFFASDMIAAVRRLWELVGPGGTLAITTWGSRLFEPASGAFWRSVAAERPDLHRAFNPWDRVDDPGALRLLMSQAGAVPADIAVERATHVIASPDDWWTIVVGSGFRGIVDALTSEERERVRAANIAALQRSGVRALTADVIYGTARKRALPARSPRCAV